MRQFLIGFHDGPFRNQSAAADCEARLVLHFSLESQVDRVEYPT